MKLFYFLFFFVFFVSVTPSAFCQKTETFKIDIRHIHHHPGGVPNNPMFQKPRIVYEVNGSGEITVDSKGKIHGQAKLTFNENNEYETEDQLEGNDIRTRVITSGRGTFQAQIKGRQIGSYLWIWFEDKFFLLEHETTFHTPGLGSWGQKIEGIFNPVVITGPGLPEPGEPQLNIDSEEELESYIEGVKRMNVNGLLPYPNLTEPNNYPGILKRQNGELKNISRVVVSPQGEYLETNITTRIEPPQVVDVAWEALDSPLDKNPNPGGGKRIFPGKATPSDTLDRRRVKVKATISPPKEGVKIFFRAFDVDDPSSDTAPVDPNGSNGDDNYGLLYYNQAGTLGSPSATTNAQGEATADFTVTMQPGDNYKVAVATEEQLLSDLHVKGTKLLNSSGKTAPTNEIKITDLLTVWRKLHIEVDSMGKIAGNQIKGNIFYFNSRVTSQPPTIAEVDVDLSSKDISKNLDDNPPGNGRFENGSLRVAETITILNIGANGDYKIGDINGLDLIENSLLFVVQSNSSNSTPLNSGLITKIQRVSENPIRWWLYVDVGGNNPVDKSAIGKVIVIPKGSPMKIINVLPDLKIVEVDKLSIPFVLKDDDLLVDDVPTPDIGALTSTFAPAYVLPLADVGDNNSNVPFRLNLTCNPEKARKVFDFDEIATEANSDFWTIYILGAYQAGTEEDLDPHSEPSTLGCAIDDLGVLVFMETLVDPDLANTSGEERVLISPALVTAHEVGHLFSGAHEDLGLMTDEYFGGRTFSDVTLDRIRRIAHP